MSWMKSPLPQLNVLPQPVFHNWLIHKSVGLQLDWVCLCGSGQVCLCVHTIKWTRGWGEIHCSTQKAKQNTQITEEHLCLLGGRDVLYPRIFGEHLGVFCLLCCVAAVFWKSGAHRVACILVFLGGREGGELDSPITPCSKNGAWLGPQWSSRKTSQTRGRLWIHDKAGKAQASRHTAETIWINLRNYCKLLLVS